MEIEVTKKDMVSLIYRMRNTTFDKGCYSMEGRMKLDTQIAAIVSIIDPTGEFKNECETENFLSKLQSDIFKEQNERSKLETRLKKIQGYDKLVWLAVLASIASLVMALVAVVWG